MNSLNGVQAVRKTASHSTVFRSGWALSLIVFGLSAPAYAQNGTTVGSLTLSSTLNCISLSASFSGDANANNSVTVQFKKQTGDTGYHAAYTAYIDRRATVGGSANPYANEARVSIVGLVEDTLYDVQVTWSDPNGVTGQALLGTVKTLSSSPPAGGSTISVSNNASLSSALSSVNPGQTIHLTAGTYNPFTISRSGNSSAWIVIEGEAGTTITGAGVNQNIAVNANYIVVKNLTLSASDFHGITIGSSRHDVIIEDNTLQNVSRLCANGPSTTHLQDSGILVGGSAYNIFVLRNSIASTSLQACVQNPTYDGPGQGISLTKCTTCVFMGNTITGAFRDGITSDNSNNSIANIDMANNTVTNYVDDGVEAKGDNLNVRLWGNVITSSQANTCLAGNTNTITNRYGPLYVFRNVCKITGNAFSAGGGVFKGPGGPAYFFHNSIDTGGVSPAWASWCFSCGASSIGSGPYVMLNNAVKSSGAMSEGAPSTTISNYSVGTASQFAYLWDGTTTYTTFASFRAGTGQEANGLNVDPRFSDTALHLQVISPAINAGVVLNNFNSLDSAWPYSGSAPDVGSYEVEGAPVIPQAPTNLRIVP